MTVATCAASTEAHRSAHVTVGAVDERSRIPRAALRDVDATALRTDHYELTMVASALESGVAHRSAVFEVFARRLPAGRAYGVVAGMNRVIDAIEHFRFTDAAIAHLIGSGVVSEGPMTDWLANYHFSGDVTGYADGELYFPYSPVLAVEGSFAECVVLETVLLSVLNHDCAIASAAARVKDVAKDRKSTRLNSSHSQQSRMPSSA